MHVIHPENRKNGINTTEIKHSHVYIAAEMVGIKTMAKRSEQAIPCLCLFISLFLQ